MKSNTNAGARRLSRRIMLAIAVGCIGCGLVSIGCRSPQKKAMDARMTTLLDSLQGSQPDYAVPTYPGDSITITGKTYRLDQPGIWMSLDAFLDGAQ